MNSGLDVQLSESFIAEVDKQHPEKQLLVCVSAKALIKEILRGTIRVDRLNAAIEQGRFDPNALVIVTRGDGQNYSIPFYTAYFMNNPKNAIVVRALMQQFPRCDDPNNLDSSNAIPTFFAATLRQSWMLKQVLADSRVNPNLFLEDLPEECIGGFHVSRGEKLFTQPLVTGDSETALEYMASKHASNARAVRSDRRSGPLSHYRSTARSLELLMDAGAVITPKVREIIEKAEHSVDTRIAVKKLKAIDARCAQILENPEEAQLCDRDMCWLYASGNLYKLVEIGLQNETVRQKLLDAHSLLPQWMQQELATTYNILQREDDVRFSWVERLEQQIASEKTRRGVRHG